MPEWQRRLPDPSTPPSITYGTQRDNEEYMMAEAPQGRPTHDVNTAAGEMAGLLSEDPNFGIVEDEGGDSGSEEESPAEDASEDEELEGSEEELEDDAEEFVDEEDDEGDEEPEDSDDPQTFTVKVDGEELSVTLDEALAGYQRQQAFTRKTQELAEERRAFQAEIEQVRAEREQYSERLEQLGEFLQATISEEPPEDPEEFKAWRAQQQQLQNVRAEQERVRQVQQEEFQQAQQARVAEEQAKLAEAIPDLGDAGKREPLMSKMIQTAQTTYGFTPEELGAVVDHRAVRLLHDAMLYREAVAEGANLRKSAKKSSPNLKPGAAKPKSKGKKKPKKSAARDRLRKGSGSLHDAAEALAGLFD